MLDGKSNDERKTFYIMPTTECNLKCSHCDIRTHDIMFNEHGFFDTVKRVSVETNKEIILFGGEPTLHRDRLCRILDILDLKPIISTNLLEVDDKLMSIFKTRIKRISTSWNEFRFTSDQYALWKKNLIWLGLENIGCTIMVTMTYGLMKDGVSTILRLLDDLKHIKSVEKIQFEYLVGEKNYAELADNWLCELHWHWCKYPFIHVLEDRISKSNGLMNDCSNVYTVHPNGNIVFGCPHFKPRIFIRKCFDCDMKKHCIPCQVQCACSFPKKLFNLLLSK